MVYVSWETRGQFHQHFMRSIWVSRFNPTLLTHGMGVQRRCWAYFLVRSNGEVGHNFVGETVEKWLLAHLRFAPKCCWNWLQYTQVRKKLSAGFEWNQLGFILWNWKARREGKKRLRRPIQILIVFPQWRLYKTWRLNLKWWRHWFCLWRHLVSLKIDCSANYKFCHEQMMANDRALVIEV
jgi:hypothetical protein